MVQACIQRTPTHPLVYADIETLLCQEHIFCKQLLGYLDPIQWYSKKESVCTGRAAATMGVKGGTLFGIYTSRAREEIAPLIFVPFWPA